MTTPPFISACHSMMASEVGEPRRVGGPTRHGGVPMRPGALFYLLLGRFASFGLVPRRVGGPTRHGGVPIRRGALVLPPGGFGSLELEPRRVGGPTRHGGLPMRHGVLVLRPFWVFWCLWARATSCWRPNTTWRAPNTTWRARFTLFLGDLDPWNSTHVVLEAQRVMAGSQCDVTRFFYLLSGCFGAFVWALQQKSHL